MATIAVIGGGNIGGTLGRKWARSGHHVTFGMRNPSSESAERLRLELGDGAQFKEIDELAETLAAADAVVFAIPAAAMDDTIGKYANLLDDRTVIDTTNRMGGSGVMNSLATFRAKSPRARYFRAFNTLGYENFQNPFFDGVAADLFYCGPEGEAGSLVRGLISDIGLRPVRLGDSDQTDLVDSLTGLWFALAIRQQHGRHLAFKVLGM